MSEPKKPINYQKILILVLTTTTIFFFGTTVFFGYTKFLPAVRSLNISSDTNTQNEILSDIKDYYIGDYPSNDTLAQGQLKGIVESLDDPYSEYLPKDENQQFQDDLNKRYVGIGVAFKQNGSDIVADQVFKDSPAEKAGVQAGDVLQKIDDQSISNLSLSDAAQKIRGPKDSTVKLEFSRVGKTFDFSIVREDITTDLITLTTQDDVAIITITSFGDGLDTLMANISQQILKNPAIKRIIIDLRSNTGGLLNQATDVISYFVDPNQVILQEKTKTATTNDYSITEQNSLKNYPIAVLTDKNTASASEIMAGALRDIRGAKLVGQTTYGKGVVQKLFDLGDGNTLKLTVAEWLTPKGLEINKKGLDPDISVKVGDDSLATAIKSGF
jgi:carboxyl-terminal processing protease